jgi:hypothetical protein
MPTPTYTPPLAVQWNRYTCDALYFTNTPPTIAARWYGVSDPYHYLRVFGRTSMHTYPKKAEVK